MPLVNACFESIAPLFQRPRKALIPAPIFAFLEQIATALGPLAKFLLDGVISTFSHLEVLFWWVVLISVVIGQLCLSDFQFKPALDCLKKIVSTIALFKKDIHLFLLQSIDSILVHGVSGAPLLVRSFDHYSLFPGLFENLCPVLLRPRAQTPTSKPFRCSFLFVA